MDNPQASILIFGVRERKKVEFINNHEFPLIRHPNPVVVSPKTVCKL